MVRRLDHASVDDDRQTKRFGNGLRCFLCAFQWGTPEMHHIPVPQVFGNPLSHLPATLGKVIVGQPAVEQRGRVVHLSVSHEMHNRPVLTHPGLLARYPEALAAASAAAGSASTIRLTALSSCAAETNQASY